MSGWVDYESSPFAICFINMRDSNDFHIFQILPENHEVIPANADRPPEVSKNEPRCEKTGLWGFRPGPTQTGLYNHRRWLEA